MAHVEVNDKAPAVGTAEGTINAPVETVWKVLTDFEKWPAWNEAVSKIEVDGPVEVGMSFRWTAGGSKIRSRLEEVDPPHVLAWSGKSLGIHAVHVWRFQSEGDATRAHTSESFDGLLAKLMSGSLSKMLKQALSQGLLALKKEAESRHAAEE
jgi:uncharacterized protein YndB with AHSA1/START domain